MNHFSRIFFVSLIIVFSFSGILFGAKKRNITIKGSDTMIILSQKWAEKFMETHKDITIQVTGGGSGTGITAMINGTCDIANASRPMKQKEFKNAQENGIKAVEHKVALDAIVIVVNKDNPVNELTVEQISGIYRGAINNWKDVGGKDEPIIRYSREANSGTYVFMKEHILGDKDYAPDCQNLPGTSAIANAVAKDTKSIGYGGVAYFANNKDCKIIKIKKDANSPAISPVNEDGSINFSVVYDNSYYISRYLYCYTAGNPKGDIKTYIDWVLGPEGQKIVEEMGYIPIKK